MLELLNAFGLLSINQVASLIFGLVRTKLIASLVGQAGVGIVSQATTFMQLLKQISTMGLGGGFVKLVAEYDSQGEHVRLKKIIFTVFTVFGIIGLVEALLCFIFAEPIAAWAFDDPQQAPLVMIVGLAGLMFVQYRVVLYLFQGLLKWREFVITSIAGYGISLFITIPLIILQGTFGAVLSILITQAFNLFISILVLQRTVITPKKLTFWRSGLDTESVKRLMHFMGPLTTVAVLNTFANFYIRSDIIRQLGTEANGIYDVIWKISIAYMGLITGALFSYGVPKVSTMLDDPKAMIKIQNHELRLGILILSPLVIGLMTLREIWIPILYSSEFLLAGSFLVWQLGGDMFRMARQTINLTLVPLERFGYIYFDGILYSAGWALLSKLLIPQMGIVAVPLSYFIINIVATAAGTIYQFRTTSYRIGRTNLILLAKATPLVVAGMLIAQQVPDILVRTAAVGAIVLLMLVWLPRRDEYQDLIKLVRDQITAFQNSKKTS
ncbi:MAG: oligosaccharide flippase family protein [Anaerolineae bacterium]|nr:oligosaccharide flippase family protein [Anaerolineae bacterium]